MNTNSKKSEARFQQECYTYFHETYKDLRGLLIHVPNGMIRRKMDAAILRGMGVVAGVPDFLLFFRGKTYFIELKTTTGKLTKIQQEYHEKLRAQGFEVYVVKKFEEFVKLLNEIFYERHEKLREKIRNIEGRG